MIALPSLQAELAAAVRRVNATYDQVAQPEQAKLSGPDWDQAEAEVNAAMQTGKRARAIAAVEAWESFALARIRDTAGLRVNTQQTDLGGGP